MKLAQTVKQTIYGGFFFFVIKKKLVNTSSREI